ncbi:hypothetical protein GCM10011506_42410 [Marivirga lumbricoides]|uniref:Translocation and assembly module TamB C-terminal domain-containing protein n=1 Tax=Marivirga lumbricoides TaxID=1046115 RepID=A0ABQ1N2X2_9BACT|nr:hypothetical protein GCM10011506_42410 [Marivirga lumbricoides]
MVLSLRLPIVQQKITDFATNYVSDKTNTEVNIDRLYISFLGEAVVEGIYLEDQQKDTLLYTKSILVDVAWGPAFSGDIIVKNFELDGLRANVHNKATDSTFNYQFLIDAFASDSTKQAPQPEKQSTTTFTIKEASLHNIDLNYSDRILGMQASLALKNLQTELNEFNLDSLFFDVADFTLSGVKADYKQLNPFPEAPEETDSVSALPVISLDHLELSDIDISYSTPFDSTFLAGKWQSLILKKAGIDLNKNNLSVEEFSNQQYRMEIALAAAQPADSTTVNADNANSANAFEWPEWKVAVNQFNFQLDSLSFHQGNKPLNRQSFNPSHMEFQDLDLKISGLNYKPEFLALEKIMLSATDSTLFRLKELSTGISIDSEKAVISDLTLRTAQSSFQSDLVLKYQQFDSVINGNLSGSTMDLQLGLGTRLELKDAYYFAPELRADTAYRNLAKYPVQIYGNLAGTTEEMEINQFKLFYGEYTSLSIDGKAERLLSPDELSVFVSSINLKARTKDFSGFVPENYPDQYPQKIELSGSGSWNNGLAKADIQSIIDEISLLNIEGSFNSNEPQKYDVKVKGEQLAIDKWLQDTASYDPVDIILNVEGTGMDLATLNAKADLKILNLSYQSHQFNPLELEAELKDKQFSLHSEYADKILDYDINALGTIDSTKQSVRLKAQINRMNLLAFGIADSLTYLKMNTIAELDVTDTYQKIDLNISNFSFGNNNSAYPFEPLHLALYNSQDSSRIDLDWEEIAVLTQMNQPLNTLSNFSLNLTELMDSRFFSEDSTKNPLQVRFKVKAALTDNIENFIPEGITFQPISFYGNYSAKKEEIEIHLDLPGLVFNNIDIDSLMMDIVSDSSTLDASVSIKKITSDVIDIYPTSLTADVGEQQALFNFLMEDENQDSLYYINAEAQSRNDSLYWNIINKNLTLNSKPWQIDENNSLYFNENGPVIRDMILQRNQQYFGISTELKEDITSMLFEFRNFKIENLLSIINAEESPLKGALKGEIKLKDFQKPLDMFVSISLDNIEVMHEEAGNLKINVEQEATNRYGFNVGLDGPVNIESNGWFNNGSDTLQFEAKTNFNQISLPFISKFTEDYINKAEGILTGNFNINGTPQDFDYSGKLQFQEASFSLAELNTTFKLPNETILLEDETIELNKFTLVDENGQKMLLNGTIRTESFIDPEIDLELQANNFQLLNSSAEDNELFYGKVFADLNIDWKGSLSSASIGADVRINDQTDFVYVIPESGVDLVESEGIVQFRNPYEPRDSIQYDSAQNVQSTQISGIEVSANIETDKSAKFKVIVDKRRGDFLTVSGETDLSLIMRKNGTISLSGNYIVNNGFYQLSLYDLVKRKFEIKQGSQISWSGDPLGASLDITALYNLQASVNSLMADQISGSSIEVKNQYRQKLPFIVQLFVKGNLSEPEISFGLEMPQDSRGALGGNVYQQVQAINRNESQLNKQVFSLLVLNQFFPAGSESTGPDSEQIARNSASQILSNQLNKLSSKYVKGVDLNLDLKSYEDYQSGTAQDRTQLDVSLSKSLFDNRVRVKVGSQVDLEGDQRQDQRATDIIGNVVVEYLLTEDGRYMLTGFRKSEYQGILDGQVVVTGVSIKFTKEFDKLRELWNNENESENKGDAETNE